MGVPHTEELQDRLTLGPRGQCGRGLGGSSKNLEYHFHVFSPYLFDISETLPPDVNRLREKKKITQYTQLHSYRLDKTVHFSSNTSLGLSLNKTLLTLSRHSVVRASPGLVLLLCLGSWSASGGQSVLEHWSVLRG